jgi:diketogulonate reductase-like aldo/keto reductase
VTALVHANGAAIPAIGLGTGRLRGEVLINAVHAALAHGYRHIDTAAKYGNELDVAEAIRTQDVPPAEICVTTKVLPDPDAAQFERAAEASVRRLGVGQADLLLIHWPSQQFPIDEQVRALCATRRHGLARHVGLSNFPAGSVEIAVRAATEPLVVNQVEHHPYLDQTALATCCTSHGMALMSFCPLGRGRLLDEPVVRQIASAHGRSPAQIVLRWHVEQPMNVAVPSSSNPRRIAENIDVFGFALRDDERRALASLARPDGRVVRGPPGFVWDDDPA